MANALYAAKEWAKNSLADIKARPRNALIDATRGALLGATTDVVGYIPDAVADFMRPFGYNVPRDQVVGGTEWLANKFAQPTNSLAENAARFTTGMLTPSPMDFARLGKGPMQELTVYHGSPHRINNVDAENPMGKFDTSKIGTGEGAQAYGHGIYLAESPDVAKSYRDIAGDNLFVDDENIGVIGQLRSAKDPITASAAAHARKFVDENGVLTKEGADAARAAHADLYARNPGMIPSERLTKEAQAFSALIGKRISESPAGHFYTVDLPDEHIANMLDWDAPLSEQPPHVTSALREITDSRMGAGFYDSWLKEGGGDYRDLWGNVLGEQMDSAAISAELSKRGIPGIRYLDGGSRGNGAPSGGQGTRNFVIFDGNTAKILKRE